MDISIRSDKLEITDAMKSYAREKFSRLNKYLKNETAIANLLFNLNGYKQKLEITIPLKDFVLRVEEDGKDFYSLVDISLDKLERQIRKNKTKLAKRAKTDFKDFVSDIEDEISYNVVKRKKVLLKPMDEEEAIIQMELLGHDFYIFKNIDKLNKINVLYKRKSGDYGLIEEE